MENILAIRANNLWNQLNASIHPVSRVNAGVVFVISIAAEKRAEHPTSLAYGIARPDLPR